MELIVFDSILTIPQSKKVVLCTETNMLFEKIEDRMVNENKYVQRKLA